MLRYVDWLMCILLLASLYGAVPAAEQKAATPLPLGEYADRLDMLDQEAIEDAYKEQIKSLFLSWMKDASHQPTRALTGATNAKNAFMAAMNAVETRRRENH